jgi:hypothetical protein
MGPCLPDNVIRLRPRRPRATFCLDCDPRCGSPFQVSFHADPRTGDILTPCPACGRHALVEVERAGEFVEIRA